MHRQFLTLVFTIAFFLPNLRSQQNHSIAREWSDAVLVTMQEDLARPAVQARNLFHFSIALYDAWAAYDTVAQPYLLGKTTQAGFTCPCKGIPAPKDVEAARKEAISFAAFRLLTARYTHSPQSTSALFRFRELMQKHGYDFRNYSFDYTSGSPAAVGNYIAQCILQMAQKDGSNEENNYLDPKYQPANQPLDMGQWGPAKVQDPNRWQPIKMKRALGYDGYPMWECRCGGALVAFIDSVDNKGRRITGTQSCQVPSWGWVTPFALKKKDQKTYFRNGQPYRLFQDPGNDFLPRLDTAKGLGTSKEYMWNYSLVAAWSALLNPADTTMWDVSPRSMGNLQGYPRNLAELPSFYNPQTGRDPGTGHPLNPHTGQPYPQKWVPRGDFTRVVAQYWAEGPDKEGATGNWLTLLNYINDQPGLVKKFNGKGPVLSDLEWDVKAYFVLGGALHDAAISTWGLKGWYDGVRPISALRYMAARGQSSDPSLPAYHPAGIPLIPGQIELIKKGDLLAGGKNQNLNKIKLFAWKGPYAVADSTVNTAGVDWILAENWHPYQQKTFVTPNYPGFVSAHAALSHSAAGALTLLTGDAYFPGGLGQFTVAANSNFLRIEQGPGVEVTLQWATYRDAADQASLSRIWCGTNAPFEDIPGRVIGEETGTAAFHFAKKYFYKDRDGDGWLGFEDCDDNNPKIHTGAPEICDNQDNNCNGLIDEDLVCPPTSGGKQ